MSEAQMSNVATITLPWPPSVNTYWRHVVIGRSARVLISREGREYRDAVRLAVLRRWPGLCRPLEGRLDVSVVVHCPDRRARDLDNLGKAILDGLANAGVYANDSQIDRLQFVRSNKIGQPGSVDVTLGLVKT